MKQHEIISEIDRLNTEHSILLDKYMNDEACDSDLAGVTHDKLISLEKEATKLLKQLLSNEEKLNNESK